jgi:glycosyltransferase involved in cell wall biosynthesis
VFSTVKPDVVHTHGYRPDVLASGVARALRIPRVTTVHGFTGGDWKNRLYEFLQVRAFKRYQAVVAVSNPLADRLRHRGVPGSLLQVIANGFDPSADALSREDARQALGLPAAGTVLGWVGRLSPEKGPDVMLKALAQLERPEVILSMVGSGAEREALDAQAAGLVVAAQVRWHGLVPDARRLYRAFDAFVLSSRTEGTPISLFEAMTARVPVIATAVGGVPDVLRESEGWPVSPGDPDALAAAIRAALVDRAESSRRAERAFERVTRVYGLDPWLDQYDRLYRSLLPRTP